MFKKRKHPCATGCNVSHSDVRRVKGTTFSLTLPHKRIRIHSNDKSITLQTASAEKIHMAMVEEIKDA